MSEESERDYYQGRVHVQELAAWFDKGLAAGEVAYLGGRKVLGVTVPQPGSDRWDIVVELATGENTPRALTYTYKAINMHVLVQCVQAEEEAAVQGGPQRIGPGMTPEKFDYIVQQLQESHGWQEDQATHQINPLEYLEMMRRSDDVRLQMDEDEHRRAVEAWEKFQSEDDWTLDTPERDDPSRYEADPEDRLYDPYSGSGQIDAEDYGNDPYEGGDWGPEE